MPAPGKLGWWAALLGYGALWVGMVFIGVPAQMRGIVSGLWVTEALAIALPAAVALAWAGVRFAPYLGLRAVSWKQLAVAAVASGLNQPVVSFLTWIAHQNLPRGWVADFDAKQKMFDSIFAAQGVPMLVTVVIAAPFGEELFFRGFAFPALRKSWGLVAAVVASGAMFSAMHGDPIGFVGLMEIGILLAALRHWSGSLWPAVVGHAVNNGFAGGAFLLKLEDPEAPPPAWVMAAGAALFVAGLVLLVRLLRRPSPAPAVEEPSSFGMGRAVALTALWVAALVAAQFVL
jgi:membrane protease YdiL (CAAX protease family)